MALGADETGILRTLLDWAWALVAALIGIIWKRHNEEIQSIEASIAKVGDQMNENAKFLDGRIDAIEKSTVPLSTYEQNRKETRENQIAIYQRIDGIGQALARIEGKLDK